MNSKGISIAVNQIVILIIGIVILSLGIAFLYNVLFAAEQQLPGIDARLQAQIEDSLRRGDIVEIPSSTKTIGLKDMAVFNLGIRNDPAITNSNDFTIVISAKDPTHQQWLEEGLLSPQFTPYGNKASYSFELGERQTQVFTFGISSQAVKTNKDRGQYFFNVCVFNLANSPITDCNAENYANNVNNGNYDFKTFSVIVK